MSPDARPGRRGRRRRRDEQPRDDQHAARVRAAAAARRPADRRRQRARDARQARRPRRRPLRRGRRPAISTRSTRSSSDWRAAVHAGRPRTRASARWLNIPSKVAQVAAVRAVARERRAEDLAAGRLVMALCPGLIDTDASRPWFADMSEAQTPAQAAAWPVELAARRRRSTPRSTVSSSSSAASCRGRPGSRSRTGRRPDGTPCRASAEPGGPRRAHPRRDPRAAIRPPRSAGSAARWPEMRRPTTPATRSTTRST